MAVDKQSKKDARIQQIQNQMAALQSQIGEIQEEDIVKIKWHPQRSDQKNQIKLSDGSYLVGLPDTVLDESDPQARVLLAVLGEVLTLREQLAAIHRHVGTINRPDMSPVPELKNEAVAFKDAVTTEAVKESLAKQ